MSTDTDKFLAIKFPNVSKSWLRKLSEKLGLFKSVNGGNVEIHTRFKDGHPQWTDWTMRDFNNNNQEKD